MKYLPITKKDIEGEYNIEINAATIPYKEMFVKIKKRVYRCTKAGDDDWYCQKIDKTMSFLAPKEYQMKI